MNVVTYVYVTLLVYNNQDSSQKGRFGFNPSPPEFETKVNNFYVS